MTRDCGERRLCRCFAHHEALVGPLTDLDGRLGLPADQVSSLVTGAQVRLRTAWWSLAEAGAERIVVTVQPERGTARWNLSPRLARCSTGRRAVPRGRSSGAATA